MSSNSLVLNGLHIPTISDDDLFRDDELQPFGILGPIVGNQLVFAAILKHKLITFSVN